MFDCLIGYIGLSVKASGEVESGLYCDALPGISEAHLSKLIEDESSVNDLWKEIEQRAIRKFRTFFINQVNKTHKINNVDKCECLICENKELLSTSLWYLLGEEIMFTRSSSLRINIYTNPDMGKSKDLRAEFHDSFLQELEVAVNGIDVHKSACFNCENQPQENSWITFRETIM